MATSRPPRGSAGFTLIELLWVMAIIGVLSAIAVPLFANVTARSRIAKAQADVRMLSTAISAYAAHVGELPADLDALTVTVNNFQGIVAGPFMTGPPTPPSSLWGAYVYTPGASNAFTVSGSGEGTTVSAP